MRLIAGVSLLRQKIGFQEIDSILAVNNIVINFNANFI
jgi:hypothetical protein